MPVLITGGTGVNGSWVTRFLVEEKEKVIVYDNLLDISLLKDIAKDLILVRGDILDYMKLVRTIREHSVDSIIHMAAVVSPSVTTINPKIADPYLAMKVNGEGTFNVLEAARTLDIKKVVFTSSRGVYGAITGKHAHPTYEPIDEDHPLRPVTLYDTMKVFGESLGLTYHRIYGMDFVALRFSHIYGPGKTARHGHLAIHSRMIESAMLGRQIVVEKGGETKDDWIYVKDVAMAIVLAHKARTYSHRVFHFGSGVGRSLHDLAKALIAIFPGIQITIGPGIDYLGVGSYPTYCVFDISRARSELGFEPRFGLESSIRDYIDVMNKLAISPA